MGYGKAQGFTLMEAMIVVMLLGILAVLAYPSFKDTIERNRASAAQAELNKAMSYGRSEAISRNRDIGICPQSAAGNMCGGVTDWVNGFLVYVDKNRNGAYDPPGDPVNPQPGEDEVIQYYYVKQPLSISIAYEKDVSPGNKVWVWDKIPSFHWRAGGMMLLAENLDSNKVEKAKNMKILIVPGSSSDKNKKECSIFSSGLMSCP